jgi:succinate-semialdehyde dehydrogenase/glutarate-semialdehyde dehydrogenase
MCGERLIPCTLELGGKAPLIACADADLERTARAIVFGGFVNSGQVCISVERVYAHEQIHDRLLERVTTLVSELRQGDPAAEVVDVGAVTFPKQIEIAEKHIADAIAKGAELRAGGHRKPGPGQFFEPTVLAKCDHRMTVMTDEIFGPIVPFMKVRDEEEAIALSNDSHLGLNAYVFTKDRDKGCRIAERVVAGTVMVNDVLVNHAMPSTPFGGVKQSGIGRVHGEDALRDMCDARHVNVDRFGSFEREPIWYPYTPESFKWLMKGARALFGGGGIGKKIGELI